MRLRPYMHARCGRRWVRGRFDKDGVAYSTVLYLLSCPVLCGTVLEGVWLPGRGGRSWRAAEAAEGGWVGDTVHRTPHRTVPYVREATVLGKVSGLLTLSSRLLVAFLRRDDHARPPGERSCDTSCAGEAMLGSAAEGAGGPGRGATWAF